MSKAKLILSVLLVLVLLFPIFISLLVGLDVLDRHSDIVEITRSALQMDFMKIYHNYIM